MCEQLVTPEFLCKGLYIYRDNAYINTPYMTLIFKAVMSGPKDASNIYHSQICINIECAFWMLVNRWAVLRTPIPINISIKKITLMVHCLCCFHNFLIEQKDDTCILNSTAEDGLSIASWGGINTRKK